MGTFSQPAAMPAEHVIDARLPLGQGVVDMAEMQAR